MKQVLVTKSIGLRWPTVLNFKKWAKRIKRRRWSVFVFNEGEQGHHLELNSLHFWSYRSARACADNIKSRHRSTNA